MSTAGWKSLRLTAIECLGTSMVEVVLKDVVTAVWTSNRLVMLARISVSCPAQTLSVSRDIIRL